jgi:hypothetical protein
MASDVIKEAFEVRLEDTLLVTWISKESFLRWMNCLSTVSGWVFAYLGSHSAALVDD